MKMLKNAIWILVIFNCLISNKITAYGDDFSNIKYESVSPVSSSLVSSDDDSSYENDLKSGRSEGFQSRGSRTYDDSNDGGKEDGSYDGKWVDTIPGEAGKDFPSYERIPKTSFTCQGRRVSGYYADTETDCQVFHICAAGGQKISFLCPNGSIFNQKVLVCDWWYDVDCGLSNDIIQSFEEVSRFENNHPEEVVVIDGYGIEGGYDLNLASSGGNDAPQKTSNVADVANNFEEDMRKDDREKVNGRFSKNKKTNV